MADLDLRPQRRELIVSELQDALTAAITGSHVWLRGSLSSGTADRYSDVDLCWMVPDGKFTEAVGSVRAAIAPARDVTSCRVDPGLARSDRRRLIFLRLAATPLFWRIDLDIRADSVAAEDGYDATNPAAYSEAGWSRPASAIENAIAAIKAAVRHEADSVEGLLNRGYERIGLDRGSPADLPGRITRLAGSCAALDPSLADLASEVNEVVSTLARTGLLE